MGNIVLLDDLTINQIAAGEVIERPASVVKEMVENSIDAGANEISVDIKNGGIASIRITDNGKGIAPDDMEIAFERHATSKIRTADDLETVTSMGFRGEALASIASIANVEMVSRTANTDIGYRIVVEAGNVLEKEEVGARIGTTITVKNLFFNTPVRYKFLKKDYTELGYIEDAITRLALVNPHISFKLTNNDRTIVQTVGDGNIKNCIYSIFGKDIVNGIVDVNYEYENIKVSGIIGKPDIARNNRVNQMFFVNKRFVKDKTLSAAIEQGYKGMLTVGKHAFCILNIEMNPSEVDVNVHPAKLEVRFKEENKIFKAIYNAVKDGLLNSDLVVNSENSENVGQGNMVGIPMGGIHEEAEKDNNRNKFASLFKRKPQNLSWEKEEISERMNLVEALYNDKKEGNIVKKIVEENNVEQEETKENTEEKPEVIEQKEEVLSTEEMNLKFEEMYEKTFGKKIAESVQEDEVLYDKENINEVQENIGNAEIMQQQEEVEQISQTMTINETQISNQEPTLTQNVEQVAQNMSIFENEGTYVEKVKYKFIGIAFSTYIILEIDKEMYILDQHAAHERIMYEKIKQNFYNNEAKDSQLMLLPDIITLSHKEMEIVKANYGMFEKAGFTLEEFGDNTIKLTGVPNICIDLDTKELFLNILDEIDTLSVTARQEIEEKFIATVACKAAVKANMALSYQEVEALMDDLLQLPNPFTCPHGRPTAIRMSKIDIEKKFSRR